MNDLSTLVPITNANAHRLKLLRVLGYGHFTSLAWTSDEKTIAISSSKGIWLHDADALEKPPEQLQTTIRPVNRVDFSPDCQHLASAEEDGVVRIWYLPTRSLAAELKGHEGSIQSVKFGLDGKRLFSGGSDSTVRVWDVETFTLITILTCESDIPDHPFRGEERNLSHLLVSHTSLVVCARRFTPIFVYDIETFELKFKLSELKSSFEFIHSLAFINEGKQLVIRSSFDTFSSVTFWDMTNGVIEDSIGHHIYSPEPHSRNGIWIAQPSGSHHDYPVKNVKTDQVLNSLELETDELVFNAQKTRFVRLELTGTIGKLDSASREKLGESKVSYRSRQRYIVFSKNSQKLGITESGVQLWDLPSGNAEGNFPPRVGSGGNNESSYYFDPNGNLILASRVQDYQKNSILIVDVLKNEIISEFIYDKESELDKIRSHAVNPACTLMAVGSDAGPVRLWQIQSNIQKILGRHRWRHVKSMNFSPDGTKLVIITSCRMDRKFTTTQVYVFNIKNEKEIFNTSGLHATFSPDNRHLFVSGAKQEIQIWDLRWKRRRGTLPHVSAYEKNLSFTPDSKIMVVAPSMTLELWDWKKRKELISIPILSRQVFMGTAISPDGKLIATVLGNGGEVHLYGVTAEDNL